MPRQSIVLHVLRIAGASVLVAGIAACGIKGPLRPPPKSAATPPAAVNPATPPATTSPALPPPNAK
jgi:predicted small lipoprotein YifL